MMIILMQYPIYFAMNISINNNLASWAQEPEQKVFKGLYPKQLINRLDI